MNDTITFAAVVQLIEALALIGGGGVILVKMGRMMGAFEVNSTQQTKDISEMKLEIKELTALITTVAVQKKEMESIRMDLALVRTAMDELRHGRGFIQAIAVP